MPTSSYLLAGIVAVCIGCGYGFGNHEFRHEKTAAIAFARALEAGDTTQLRRLSWGRVHSGISAIIRETPVAYTRFGSSNLGVVVIHGGGIYGGYDEFLVESQALSSCHGGVVLLMYTDKDTSRVASMRLPPPLDSVTDDACRLQINGASQGSPTPVVNGVPAANALASLHWPRLLAGTPALGNQGNACAPPSGCKSMRHQSMDSKPGRLARPLISE